MNPAFLLLIPLLPGLTAAILALFGTRLPYNAIGALAMGVGELFGDKMKTAPDRTVFLGLLARVLSAGIAGAALAPRGREQAGAAVAVAHDHRLEGRSDVAALLRRQGRRVVEHARHHAQGGLGGPVD